MHRLFVGPSPWPVTRKNGPKAWRTGTERSTITKTSSLRVKEKTLLGWPRQLRSARDPFVSPDVLVAEIL